MELRRQIVHFLFGLIIVLLIYFNIINYQIVGIFFLLSLFLNYFCKIKFINNFFKFFERESETKTFRAKGMVFYLLGTFLCLIFFEKNVAMASITILAVGDSLSTLKFNIKHPFNERKYLEASILAWLVSGFVASYFVPFYVSYIASFIAMFVESFDLRKYKIDDNLIVPLIAGLVMSLISLVWIIILIIKIIYTNLDEIF